jgi:hypothetical protein
MKLLKTSLFLLLIPTIALADAVQDCHDATGSYLTGTVVTPPSFSGGKKLNGVELSHTHLSVQADSDGKTYDVAIDNVFADNYTKNEKSVPAPLNSIMVGDKLQLCGQLYSSGLGIHWVHTNCGVTPTAAKPNGWVKKISDNGSVSDNFEDLTTYCYLWQ